MNKETIKKIQNDIIQLLPMEHQDKPGLLLADSCSELSRLAAGWIKSSDASNHVVILKGTNICDTQKAHDILAVLTIDQQVFVIDPTVWQFFPQEKSILVFMTSSIESALNMAAAKYGGSWSISEEFFHINKDEEKKYLDIIRQNMRENLELCALDSTISKNMPLEN